MINKGNFVQQAITKYGEKIGASVVTETKKGETTETTMSVNLNGKPSQTIVVL